MNSGAWLVRAKHTLLAVFTAAAIGGVAAPSRAAPPADTLVQAFAFDDLISVDPAETFEASGAEVVSNTYDPLVRLDLDDPRNVKPNLADRWTVSDDGLTFTFHLRPGLRFASGNPLTAEDVAFSFERVVKLDKSPGFLLAQFGLTPENVSSRARATDTSTFELRVDRRYAPSFVLNVLTANPLSVVDRKLVMAHVRQADYGNAWLRRNYAGSGPFRLREWRAGEIILLERNENYWGEKAKLSRVIYRYMKESSGQRLALEAGDIDIARNLEPGDLDAVAGKPGIAVTSTLKGTLFYLALNQRNRHLANTRVREALRHLVDYDAIEKTLIKGIGAKHQSLLPRGQLGALDEQPYRLDVAKAKSLLSAAGYPDGFAITVDARNTQPTAGIAEALQQTFAQAGVTLKIILGDGRQTLTKYRARNHEIYIGQWGSDYWDPNSNGETFASNPDNSDQSRTKTLAWRNAWDRPDLTRAVTAALHEADTAKRASLYEALQRTVRDSGPFIVLYQQIEAAGHRTPVQGFRLGPTSDLNTFSGVFKQ
jgi:peptide/nickel transport system substrate-binding protein